MLLAIACAGTSAPPSSGDGEPITGSERFGWDQPAADAAELATFRYAVYLDQTRSEATGVSCSPVPGGAFACSSDLPSMAAGRHTLQVAAFVLDAGVVRESARSAPVTVIRQ